MKIHLRDIRFYNNLGMNFPVCRTGERLLDLEASGYRMADSDDYKKATDKTPFCKHCIRKWNIKYSWCPIEVVK